MIPKRFLQVRRIAPGRNGRRSAAAALIAVFALSAVVPAAAENGKGARELPGYYEFYEKAGKQIRIEAEIERDEKIAAGELAPVQVDRPIEDFRLPDGFGNTIALRDYIGKKNVVLTTFRTWW